MRPAGSLLIVISKKTLLVTVSRGSEGSAATILDRKRGIARADADKIFLKDTPATLLIDRGSLLLI